jgi:two-component system chemotaxis response regulator CheY
MTKTVLVVDDSFAVRKLVSGVLAANGFLVVEAADGSQALERLDGCAPSLIITDINMPVMDGLELVRAIRATEGHRFTPIICLTTEGDDETKGEGREAGATAWIVKPFDGDRLMRAVQKLAA